jgi:RNA polymerase sigma factor (sigma-70 family)
MPRFANRVGVCGEDVTVEDEESDAVLIARSLTEPASFGAIFDRHATVLYRYLVRRIGPEDADGIVGDVFRIAFEKRHTYDGERAVARPWLYGIATNLLAKHRRREGRRLYAMARLATQRPAATDLADQVSSDVDAVHQWHRVAEIVTSLPEPERDALLLHVWEGLSYDEVADALGVPVGTVRSRLHRARGRLRELTDAGGEEHDENTENRDPGRIGS